MLLRGDKKISEHLHNLHAHVSYYMNGKTCKKCSYQAASATTVAMLSFWKGGRGKEQRITLKRDGQKGMWVKLQI